MAWTGGSSSAQLFATGPATIFAADVLFAAIVFLVFVWSEGRRLGMRHLWIQPVVTYGIGLCCALPLFLALRERHLAAQLGDDDAPTALDRAQLSPPSSGATRAAGDRRRRGAGKDASPVRADGRGEHILEVGTLGGYSTIWLARALPEDGALVTLEIDPHHARWRAPISKPQVSPSAAKSASARRSTTLEAMIAAGEAPFDMVFIDADKPGNRRLSSRRARTVALGTAIVIDNVVREGAVLDAGQHRPERAGTRALFERSLPSRGSGDCDPDRRREEMGRLAWRWPSASRRDGLTTTSCSIGPTSPSSSRATTRGRPASSI